MKNENIILEFNSIRSADIGRDLLALEVECDDQLASMFRLWLPMKPKKGGTLTYLGDKRLQVWNHVSISAGFDMKTRSLFYGYITHVRPHIEPDTSQCVLEVWGIDSSILMDREEKLVAWENKKDSDIAREILKEYPSLEKVIEDTKVVHNKEVSTIVQRETDMQFLKRLAERNGFRCYIWDRKIYFHNPSLKQGRQAVLTFKLGEEGVLRRFSAEVNGLSSTAACMYQVDRSKKEIMEAVVSEGDRYRLGTRGPSSYYPPDTPLPRAYVAMNAAFNKVEMERLCRGMVEESEWFVTAEGEVAGNKLGDILRPGGIVIVSGVGKIYSGYYYVSHVTHSFSPDGYVQHFKVKRNALVPRGADLLSPTL